MEFLTEADFHLLSNPGVVSKQLLSPHNSGSKQVTITWVTVEPGAEQPRHAHSDSEQIWVAISGEGELLLADGAVCTFRQGELVRFEKGDVHGIHVAGPETFVYLSVTSPPLDLASLYGQKP